MQLVFFFLNRSFLIAGFSILISCLSHAQYEPIVNYKIPITERMPKAKEGTFQFIVDPKYKPVFTIDILYFIERERKDEDDVLISLMECADVFIPSKQKINSNNFLPLSQYRD